MAMALKSSMTSSDVRRVVLATAGLIAGASLIFELTVQSGHKQVINAVIDALIVACVVWELRHRARTEYLALFLGMIYGTMSIIESTAGFEVTNFSPSTQLAMLILLSVVYLATREEMSSWAVVAFSCFIAGFTIVSVTTNPLSASDALGMIAVGVPGQMVVIYMMHRVMHRLHDVSSTDAAYARIQSALSRCSQALLSRGAEEPLEVALSALLDATEADYAYVDINRIDNEGHVTWELVADASGGRYPVLKDIDRKGDYLLMGDSEALLRSGSPAKVVTVDLPTQLRLLYEEEGIKSEIMAPIFIEDRWVGSIGYTDHEREGEWSELEVDALMRAADMVGAYWQREAAREGLMELAEAKDRFIAAVSHELRTPLSAVLGFAAELAERADSFSSEELNEMASFVHSQSVELTQLVDDLLTAERAASGNLTMKSEDVKLLSQVQDILAALPGPRVDVDGVETVARGDSLRVRQIVRNLITNAMKYGGDRIEVEVRSIGSSASVVVRDNGRGVRGVDSEKIFDAYYRAARTDSQPDSVGLGLAVARQLARLMDGDVTYRRERGWTTFELTLRGVEKEARPDGADGA